MPWPKGRKRAAKKDQARSAKLLVTLRNRHQEWIDVRAEDGPALRARVQQAMIEARPHAAPCMFDFAPYAQVTVRVEDIVSVRFIPGKEATPAPQAPDERSEEAR